MDNNWLNQLLMLGIGTTSLVADKIREVSDQWVKEGKINSDQAKGFVEDLMSQVKLDQPQMERYFKNMLQDMGVPRQSEVDELRGRIDRLERQVRDMENKLWR